jgi:hypothetical protein
MGAGRGRPKDPMQEAARAGTMQSYMGNPRMRQLLNVKQAFDAMQSRDPWAGRGHGQAVGQEYFNLPAAQAVTLGQQFPSGFETYAQLMDAGRAMNPGLQGAYGQANSQWGQGY